VKFHVASRHTKVYRVESRGNTLQHILTHSNSPQYRGCRGTLSLSQFSETPSEAAFLRPSEAIFLPQERQVGRGDYLAEGQQSENRVRRESLSHYSEAPSEAAFRRPSVLQHVAVCCSVLQSVAVCCSMLYCVAVCCSVLQCAAFQRPTEATLLPREKTGWQGRNWEREMVLRHSRDSTLSQIFRGTCFPRWPMFERGKQVFHIRTWTP